jgi:hypothetical protein
VQDYLFSWTADLDADGVPETLRYSSALYLPEPPEEEPEVPSQVVPTLDGGTVIQRVARSTADQRRPRQFTLEFQVCEDSFLRLAEEDYARGRRVSIRLDHRWRQLRVTSSGAADSKLTVAAGFLEHSDGDTYWLSADAEVTAGASDVKAYVTPSAGALTADTGETVPEGSVEIATISVAASLVTVATNPSGVANARTCAILAFRRVPYGGGHDGCRIVLQEVR